KAFGLMISGLLMAGTLKGQEAVRPSNSTEINTPIISNIENKKTPKNQISLSGRILKEGSKEALIGATIILKGSNLGSATDTNGAFQLTISTENSHLIKNELILEVSYLGYHSKEVIVKKEELQNNLNINLTDIHLTISSVKMPTVDCIGERFSKTNSYVVGNLPVSNNVVSHEILPLPYRDQTLYQWVLKKIRARKAKKAKDE
ncbi:MAG: carboxypeptidase-like regulatory domain-containing protein, partial [Saprospiraceae bacterium]